MQVETDQVRQKAEPAQGVHSCLRRLCFLLSMHIRNERDVDERKILVADAELELPHRLDKGRGLDIANCSAKLSDRLNNEARIYRARAHLDDANIWLFSGFIHWYLRHALYPVLDGIGHVGDNLARSAIKILTGPILSS